MNIDSTIDNIVNIFCLTQLIVLLSLAIVRCILYRPQTGLQLLVPKIRDTDDKVALLALTVRLCSVCDIRIYYQLVCISFTQSLNFQYKNSIPYACNGLQCTAQFLCVN